MDFVVAIPSYQRPVKLKKQTLSWLLNEIPASKIFVFVADTHELEVYQQVLHYEIESGLQIIVGKKGLSPQLQFIQDYFPEGQKIVRIDDDIKRLVWKNPRAFVPFVLRMFSIAHEEGCTLWGIYPVSNLFFCKDRIVIGKVFVVGHFCGFINKKSIPRLSVSECEDKAFSLQRYLSDGKTMRYEGVCASHSYFSKGGLQEHRKTAQQSDTQFVCDTFKDECTLTQKKSGVWECYWKLKVAKVRNLD